MNRDFRFWNPSCHDTDESIQNIMKKISKSISVLLTAVILTLGMSSCVVLEDYDADNGNHKGWYKNSHNPHHPFSDNPGHSKHKNKHRGKGNRHNY